MTEAIDPALYRGVIPYLNVVGAAEASIFYQKAFAARELSRKPADDGKRLMHCHLEVNGGYLMMSDCFPEYGHPHQPSDSFTMMIIDDGIDTWWDRAVAAGCEIVMPLEVQFWGDRYGQVRDPFGVSWAFNQPKKD